ncbi:NUDIX domain-containing protein [Aquiflexum gelatinilyticum]|jgi:8-oxo-dGTP pyrophosphatase MutT (NUDIX family)|uniref:NUDIX domain-containing protein n=1 Tax=Aquiflexum gelatinilyticum TaxID=2961943 RepID=UPI0021673ED1|nr:NUDIX hydrolase [Aquiflexum gelatinilyticum]MCS4433313.1 NUDIX hydrolase [Aquiflexum gelatinilyticum]
MENPWKTKSKATIYQNPWIKVEEHQVVIPSGKDGIYGKVIFKNKALAIVPVDNDLNTWLVGQFRYTLDEYSWEIPMGGGLLEVDILESAKRELKEETGLSANKWTQIMRIHTSNSVTDEEGFVFLAEDLAQGETEFEETEQLQIIKLPLKEAIQKVMDGEITDAISVAGLLKVARILNL